MESSEIKALITTGVQECIDAFKTYCLVTTIKESVEQLDPLKHNVMLQSKRPDVYVYKDNGDIDGTVLLNRIPLALQKKIAVTSAAFLGKPKMIAIPEDDAQKKMLSALNKVWEDNKLDYKFMDIAKKRMSVMQCAELWYTKKVEPEYWEEVGVKGGYKLSMMVLSPCKGDSLYPVFDDFGDMVAFGRGYKTKTAKGEEIEHFDVYTAENIYMARKEGTTWLFASAGTDGTMMYSASVKSIPNLLKKIPIVYYHQKLTEWHDVEPLIERLEEIISNHGDTNDYVGSPIVFAEGDIIGFAKKGESGKVLQGKNGAKVSYLTYDSQPASVKMEIDNLVKFIFMLTHTPEISFENMTGLGYFSNIAMQTLFLDAHLKAAGHEESFGESVQRRINLLKSALVYIDPDLKAAARMQVKPKFSFSLPKDIQEDLANINAAIVGGILSKKTGIKINPLVDDPEAEEAAILAEQDAKDEKDLQKQKDIAAINKTEPPKMGSIGFNG